MSRLNVELGQPWPCGWLFFRRRRRGGRRWYVRRKAYEGHVYDIWRSRAFIIDMRKITMCICVCMCFYQQVITYLRTQQQTKCLTTEGHLLVTWLENFCINFGNFLSFFRTNKNWNYILIIIYYVMYHTHYKDPRVFLQKSFTSFSVKINKLLKTCILKVDASFVA